MANYDKYDPKSGGFRATLKEDWLPADLKTVIGVGLDASGQVVKGSGNSGMVGVLVLTKARKAGEVVDIMTNGDIVSFNGNPGTAYFANATTGVVSSTGGAGSFRVGATVAGQRLVVRFVPTAVA